MGRNGVKASGLGRSLPCKVVRGSVSGQACRLIGAGSPDRPPKDGGSIRVHVVSDGAVPHGRGDVSVAAKLAHECVMAACFRGRGGLPTVRPNIPCIMPATIRAPTAALLALVLLRALGARAQGDPWVPASDGLPAGPVPALLEVPDEGDTRAVLAGTLGGLYRLSRSAGWAPAGILDTSIDDVTAAPDGTV